MSDNFSAQIDIQRTDEDKRIVSGWLYVSTDRDGKQVWDLKNAHCPPEVLEEASFNFVLDHRKMGVNHKTDATDEVVQVGRLAESMCFTREKWEAMGVEMAHVPYQCAWWVSFYVDNDDVWASIKRGELPDFSLSGNALADYIE